MSSKAAPVVDGLVVANWDREIFTELRVAQVDAINATVSIWEDTWQTLENIATWHRYFAEHSDLIVPVYTTADIRGAQETGRTGVILGFQNAHALGDDDRYIPLFKRLGVGVVQLTYNTVNAFGSGCFAASDSGLTPAGRRIVAALNEAGMVIDLSHVGEKTSFGVVEDTASPVVISHAFPSELKAHPRNKSTKLLREVAGTGGLVGLTHFPAFLPHENDTTLEEFVQAMEWMIDLLGVDHVAYGSDSMQGHGDDFMRWITRADGVGEQLVDYSAIELFQGIPTIKDFPNLPSCMADRGWDSETMDKVLGLNWLRVLDEVWH